MLVHVPLGYVALVYEGGVLRTVLEAGVGFVAGTGKLEVQYVDLQPQQVDEVDAATLQ